MDKKPTKGEYIVVDYKATAKAEEITDFGSKYSFI